MKPLLLNTNRSSLLATFAAITLSFAALPSHLSAEDVKSIAPDVTHIESMDAVLQAEEAKLLKQLNGSHDQFAGQMNPNTRFSINPKVPEPATIVRITELEASRDPSILQLKMELENQQRSIKKLDEGITSLNARTMKVDAALNFAQDEVLQIRTDRMLTSLKADSLHEDVSKITEQLTIEEMRQEELPQRAQYQLPRRNRRVVTGGSEQHPGSALLHANTYARAVVAIETAPLRSGPSLTFNEVFRAFGDDTVEIERRYEEWYRVIHSSGARGWIRGQFLLFGETPGDIPGKVIRIRAYDPGTDRTDWEPEVEVARSNDSWGEWCRATRKPGPCIMNDEY